MDPLLDSRIRYFSRRAAARKNACTVVRFDLRFFVFCVFGFCGLGVRIHTCAARWLERAGRSASSPGARHWSCDCRLTGRLTLPRWSILCIQDAFDVTTVRRVSLGCCPPNAIYRHTPHAPHATHAPVAHMMIASCIGSMVAQKTSSRNLASRSGVLSSASRALQHSPGRVVASLCIPRGISE